MVLLTGMRQGGAGYLALDVTNPDAGLLDDRGPYPKLPWEFTHAKLGQAWSDPVITRVKLRGTSASGDHCGHDDGDCRERWVIIFGAGYAEDGDPNAFAYVSDPASVSRSNKSKAILMVALDNGQVLASVEFDSTGAAGPAEMKTSKGQVLTIAPPTRDEPKSSGSAQSSRPNLTQIWAQKLASYSCVGP